MFIATKLSDKIKPRMTSKHKEQNSLWCNPHLIVSSPKTHNLHIIKGNYLFYHYLCDGFNDRGWGCAYRTGQTMMSFYILALEEEQPSHETAQRISALTSMPTLRPRVGSNRIVWTPSFYRTNLNQTSVHDCQTVTDRVIFRKDATMKRGIEWVTEWVFTLQN